MTQSQFSLDHHLAELRQVGDDLRAAREADRRSRAQEQANRPASASTSKVAWSRFTRLAAS